jgi:protease-4
MKSFFSNFFAGLLAIIVFLAIVIVVVKVKMDDKPDIKDHSYLVVDIYGSIMEYNPPGGMMESVLGGSPETLQRILTNLEKASVDKRIDGVIMKLSASNDAGGAMIQEIRQGIKKVRAAGKPVYAFTDNMDRNSFLLASACDSIFAPPVAYINFTGMRAQTFHVKNMLDKLGIKPNIHKIKDYKSAAEMVIREDMSPEAKEMRSWMLDEFWEIASAAISDDRGLLEADLIALMEKALFVAQEAKEAGLVDRLMYWDELENQLKQEDDETLRTISQSEYAKIKPEKLGFKGKKTIAVVHAQGTIGGRYNKVDPLLGVMMGHESVNKELRKARKDDDVAAVIFRIDSGGGESLTSDLIGHEVEVLAGEKPVVVSMVDVAASGGYMIAYRATKMMADPMTITGSIGSISGKFNIKAFHEKLGITHDVVTKGPNALLYSDQRDFTPEERANFEENHWKDFNIWLANVARHRKMPFEQAEKLAHGRVWTGRQAKANGLIDEVGGLDEAIALAKQLADIPEDEQVTVVHYPECEKGFLSSLLGGGLVASIQWAVYNYIHHEALESVKTMSSGGPVYMLDEAVVR